MLVRMLVPATGEDYSEQLWQTQDMRVNVVSGKRRSHRAHTPQRRNTDVRKDSSKLERVKDGVRQFVLNKASIGEFYEALRGAIRRGELSPNPLTGVRFRKIVKQVVDERKRQAKKRS
jgi:hypothetical protein